MTPFIEAVFLGFIVDQKQNLIIFTYIFDGNNVFYYPFSFSVVYCYFTIREEPPRIPLGALLRLQKKQARGQSRTSIPIDSFLRERSRSEHRIDLKPHILTDAP